MRKTFLATSLAAVMLAACGGGGGSSSGGSTPPPSNNTGTGTVNGVVTDSSTGARLQGVTVSAGGQTTTTDAQGTFTLSGLAAGPSVVQVERSGYAPGYGNADLGAEPAAVVVSLKKEGTAKGYIATTTATLSQQTEAGPYAVIFTPNSLNTTDTNLTVSVTPLDPTKESAVLPGQLATNTTVLLPLTFAEFSIRDSAGNRINLKAGQEAIVELPIPPSLRAQPQYQPGQTVHCYSYNPATGQWEDFVVGQIQASSVDGKTPVVRASIKHFSWYGAAPETNDCVDFYGQVVSAVDGRPLPNARVEAFPGTVATSDANGNFVVIAPRTGANEFLATRTFIDTDGSASGMPGAKVIEFGKIVDVPLTGLVSRPCSGAPAPAVRLAGQATDRAKIAIGNIGQVNYRVDAWIMAPNSLFASVSEALPDGTTGAPATNAKITVSGAGQTITLTHLSGGTYYDPAATAISPGQRYTITIDADGNGSIDGTGSVFTVGTLAWVNPTDAATVTASGLTASWSDTGALGGDPSYSVIYYAWIANDSTTNPTFDVAYYLGSDRQFSVTSLVNTGAPLAAGAYTGWVWAFSGPYAISNGSADFDVTNNISGATVAGKFYSYGTISSPISFTLN